MQGWAPDFVPKLVQDAVDMQYIDTLTHIGGEEAMRTAQQLAKHTGIFSGTSGGGCLACAIAFAQSDEAKPGTNIVAMLPDTAERYVPYLTHNIPFHATLSSNYTNLGT